MSLFTRKLRNGADLTAADESTLNKLAEPSRQIERRGDILPDGSKPSSLILFLEGWACRYKQLENGKRQIISIFLPGDLSEPFGAVPPFMDHSFGALTSVRFAQVTPGTMRSVVESSPRIAEALWWDLLMAEAVLRERAISLGRRSATERMGHLFCELQLRLAMIGLADQSSYDLPLTQADLADLFGLSTVHVNRSLQELRGLGLISLRKGRLTIHDVHTLREFSLFDAAYLRSRGSNLN